MLSISFFTLGLVCLGLAMVWAVVWPKDRTPEPLKQLPQYQPRPVWVHTALRWFHSLAWVWLAVTCWLLNAGQEQLATISALLAGIMYVTFVAALVKDGQRRKALKLESLSSPSDRQSDE